MLYYFFYIAKYKGKTFVYFLKDPRLDGGLIILTQTI